MYIVFGINTDITSINCLEAYTYREDCAYLVNLRSCRAPSCRDCVSPSHVCSDW